MYRHQPLKPRDGNRPRVQNPARHPPENLNGSLLQIRGMRSLVVSYQDQWSVLMNYRMILDFVRLTLS